MSSIEKVGFVPMSTTLADLELTFHGVVLKVTQCMLPYIEVWFTT